MRRDGEEEDRKGDRERGKGKESNRLESDGISGKERREERQKVKKRKREDRRE